MATTYTDATMGARAIGARTNSAGTGVTDVSAEEDRYSQIILTEGWIKPSDAFEPVAGAAASMNVIVGSGTAKADYYVVAGDIAGQGNYLVRLAGATQTVTLNAADGSLARKDEIYLVVLDNAYDSTGLALPRFAYRDGTPAASPSAPGPDSSWDAYVLLATIDVPAAAADILACTITDERAASTLAIGNFASDTSATPTAIVPDATGAEGTAKTFSRSDHTHAITAGTPGTIEPDDAASEGVATTFARGDHQHAITTAAASQLTPDQANAEGSAASFARSDHIHNVPAGTPGTITPDVTASEGSAASFARSDHRHAITAGTPSSLTPDASNAEGSSSSFARADHIHNVPAGTPVDIGSANSEGAGTSFARHNHVHDIGNLNSIGVKVGGSRSGSGSGTNLTTSYVDHANVSFAIPAGWSTAYVSAWGTASFINPGGDVPEARIEIGSSNGSQAQGELSGNEITLGAEHQASVSGTVTIAIAVRSTPGTSGQILSSFVSYIAIKTS